MSKKSTYQEELTTEMHAELSVSPDTARKFVVFAALDCIEDGTFTKEEAMEAYEVTLEEINKYSEEYYALV
jgi:hypothetical protein